MPAAAPAAAAAPPVKRRRNSGSVQVIMAPHHGIMSNSTSASPRQAFSPRCETRKAAGLAEDDMTAGDDLGEVNVDQINLVSLPPRSPPVRPSFVPPLQPTPRPHGTQLGPPEAGAQSSDRPTMDGAPDATAWLYQKGKEAFDRRSFDEALQSFEFCVAKLRESHVRRGSPADSFDPKATGYRHLDDYYDLCLTRVASEHSVNGSATHAMHGSPGGAAAVAATAGTAGGGTGQQNTRTTLIMVCSPRAAPLPHLGDEAVDVANVMPSHIRRGGSATDLRNELLRHSYSHFLFAGHGDAELGPSGASHAPHASSSTKTLGFTSPSGGLETVTPETLADVLGAHGSFRGRGSLCTVVLNGCETESIGLRVRDAGVPYVLCWRTKAENTAARTLATSFFASLGAGRGHEQAFDDAKAAVRCMTRPGRLASGVPSSVPAYELRDPFGRAPTEDPAAGAATARDGETAVRRGFSPTPMAAGVPLLLCPDGGCMV